MNKNECTSDIIAIKPNICIILCDEMFKYQEIQATAYKTGGGKNVLFCSRFY